MSDKDIELKNNDSQKDPIEDEISQIFKAADDLIKVLEKLAPKTNSKDVVNPEAFMKIIRPLSINVENLLPNLNDFEDNLRYMNDDRADELKRKIMHLEDDLLPQVLSYIDKYDKEHPRKTESSDDALKS